MPSKTRKIFPTIIAFHWLMIFKKEEEEEEEEEKKSRIMMVNLL